MAIMATTMSRTPAKPPRKNELPKSVVTSAMNQMAPKTINSPERTKMMGQLYVLLGFTYVVNIEQNLEKRC